MTASLVVKMSMSLDGYVAPPDGSGAWITAGSSPDARDWNLEVVSGAAAHLLGAVTYSQLAGFYPTATISFARPMNEIPKVVFSNSLTHAEWGPATIASGDLVGNVDRLKQENDGYLLAHAGPQFVRSLIEADLVDEYRLMVHPVVLGDGSRIFSTPLTLESASAATFSGGAVGYAFAARPA